MKAKYSFRKHPLYKVFLWVALASSLFLLWQMNKSILSNANYIPIDDFSHYWAAGRLNIEGRNPYDPQEVQELRNSIVGKSTSYDIIPINWTPPWSLFILMPYGVLDYPLSRLIWLISNIALLIFGANLIWKIYHGNKGLLFFAWVISFLFGPTISVLEKGQITTFIFFGIVGFLYFTVHKKNSFSAGIFIVLISIKPQLAYLLFPAILIWVIQYKDWKMALGGFIGLVGAVSLASIWNHGVLFEYIHALTLYPPADWATPTIGGYLRLVLGTDHFILQFTAPLVGLLIFLVYWLRHKDTWQWASALPVLLFASIITAPYAWTYDQVVLLPAILLIGTLLLPVKEDNGAIFIWLAYLGINLLDLFLHRYLNDFWFFWLAPAYLTWFYIANKRIINMNSRITITN